MNERMTDSEIYGLAARIGMGRVTLMQLREFADAVARASEKEKDAEIVKKDAVIKALADALEQARRELPNFFAGAAAATIDAAIRLVGRLP